MHFDFHTFLGFPGTNPKNFQTPIPKADVKDDESYDFRYFSLSRERFNQTLLDLFQWQANIDKRDCYYFSGSHISQKRYRQRCSQNIDSVEGFKRKKKKKTSIELIEFVDNVLQT